MASCDLMDTAHHPPLPRKDVRTCPNDVPRGISHRRHRHFLFIVGAGFREATQGLDDLVQLCLVNTLLPLELQRDIQRDTGKQDHPIT